MPMSEDQLHKSKLKLRDGLQRLTRWYLRRMRNKHIGSPRAYRFDKEVRALKSLFEEITPEKYKTLNAAQQQGALRGAERWCERDEDVIRQRRALRPSEGTADVNRQRRTPRSDRPREPTTPAGSDEHGAPIVRGYRGRESAAPYTPPRAPRRAT